MNQSIILTLTIVRHGQTDYNKKKITQGQLDIPLDEIGIQQAISAGLKLKDESFDCIYSSDLSRAITTASEITKQNVASSRERLGVQRDALLRERALGVMENRPWDDFTKAANEAGKFGQDENTFVPLNGEHNDDVLQRAKKFLDKLCSDFRDVSDLVPSRNKSFKILIASHGIWICQFIRLITSKYKCEGFPKDELDYVLRTSDIPNTGISKFKLKITDKGKVESVSCLLFCSDDHLLNTL